MPQKKLTNRFIKSIDDPDKPIAYQDTKAEGLNLRVTKTGTKTFSYRYRMHGKYQRYTIGRYPSTTLSEARDEVIRLKNEINKGRDPKEEQKKRKNPTTFKELVDDYKQKYLPQKKASTQKEYERILDNELVEEFGTMGIDSVNRSRLKRLLDRKAYTDESTVMANRIRAVASSLFSFAINQGLVEKNPIKSIDTYEKAAKRNRVYTKKEIKELWVYFGKQNQPIDSYLKILLLLGQRKTETMKMQWNEIQGDVWVIPPERSKNSKEHRVPLPPLAQRIISDLRGYSGKSDYVFLSPRADNKPLSSVRSCAQRIQENTKVKDFRYHDLRRTVATNMAKIGIQRNIVGKILNHKSASEDDMITAIYDRYDYDSEKREALQKWENRLKEFFGLRGSLDAMVDWSDSQLH